MERLKSLRLQKGLYQKDIAEFLDVERTTYVKYENGVIEPGHEVLSKLANFYGVTVDFILGREESDARKIKLAELSEAETAFLVAYRAHPEMHEAIHRLLGIEPKEDDMWLAAAPKVTPAIIDLDSDKVDIT